LLNFKRSGAKLKMSISAENSTVSGTSVRLLHPDSTGKQEILQQTWSNHGLLTATFCSLWLYKRPEKDELEDEWKGEQTRKKNTETGEYWTEEKRVQVTKGEFVFFGLSKLFFALISGQISSRKIHRYF